MDYGAKLCVIQRVETGIGQTPYNQYYAFLMTIIDSLH